MNGLGLPYMLRYVWDVTVPEDNHWHVGGTALVVFFRFCWFRKYEDQRLSCDQHEENDVEVGIEFLPR